MVNTSSFELASPSYALSLALIIALLLVVAALLVYSLKLLTRNQIVESLRDGIIIFDRRDRVTDINPAAQNFFDLAGQPVIGKPAAEVFERFPDLLEQIEEQSPSRVEISIQGAAERRHLEVTISPMSHKTGIRLGRAAVIRDMTGWVKLSEEVERLATTDTLTGLRNRGNFLQACEFEIKRSFRYQRPLALLLVDIDFFKKINDEHSYAIGDKTLKVLAAALRDRVRQRDVVGRYDGGEFAILLPETDCSAALKTAERIRLEISKLPIRAEHGTFNVTVSIGVSALGETEIKTLPDLLNAADVALRHAKVNGRNRVEGQSSTIANG